MRRLLASFAAFTLVVAAPGMARSAAAHGGTYKGPPGEVPPDSRNPSDPPPPPEGGPPSTPGGEPGGGPTTGGATPGGSPTTPGGGTGGGSPTGGTGGPTVGGGPGGSPSTPGGRGGGAAKAGAGYGSWVFWWGYNKDEFLRMKDAAWRLRRPIGSATTAFGRRDDHVAVGQAEIFDKIVPALRALLADEKESFHVRSAAELGLAKIGDVSIAPTLEKFAVADKKDLHREVVETAALALGLLQRDDDGVRRFLAELVADPTKDGTYARPFAAVSLGLLGGTSESARAAAHVLVDEAARKEPGVDVKPASFEALGLLGDESSVPELLAAVRNGKTSAPGATPLTEIETSYAVAALGKIGRPGLDRAGEESCVLDALLELSDKDRSKAGFDVRRSAAIALGEIGPHCTGKQRRRVLDALKSLADGAAGDEQERNFAVMSLARFGAARGADATERKEIVATLVRHMDQKGRGQTPAFAAMALGIVGRAVCDDGGAAPEEDIRAPLRAKFLSGGDPHERGAYALASGLVRDPLAVDELKKTLCDRGADKRVRGWCALALGLIGDVGSVDAVRDAMKDQGDRDLRIQAAMAAGLVGDPRVLEDLIAIVRNQESSNYELGSAALALGQIGDSKAVDALLEVAVDKTKKWPDLTRALAVVALGQIGDRSRLPSLARVGADVNYRAHVPAIAELLSIL